MNEKDRILQEKGFFNVTDIVKSLKNKDYSDALDSIKASDYPDDIKYSLEEFLKKLDVPLQKNIYAVSKNICHGFRINSESAVIEDAYIICKYKIDYNAVELNIHENLRMSDVSFTNCQFDELREFCFYDCNFHNIVVDGAALRVKFNACELEHITINKDISCEVRGSLVNDLVLTQSKLLKITDSKVNNLSIMEGSETELTQVHGDGYIQFNNEFNYEGLFINDCNLNDIQISAPNHKYGGGAVRRLFINDCYLNNLDLICNNTMGAWGMRLNGSQLDSFNFTNLMFEEGENKRSLINNMQIHNTEIQESNIILDESSIKNLTIKNHTGHLNHDKMCNQIPSSSY